jgi:hypothetical protein
MPSLIFSRALTANQLGDEPLASWQFERVPNAFVRGAYIKVLQRATTTGARTTIFSGSTTIQQRSNIQGGGTAGVTPSPLNTPVIDFLGSPDDKIQILNDEVAAGTPTIDGIVSIEPV